MAKSLTMRLVTGKGSERSRVPVLRGSWQERGFGGKGPLAFLPIGRVPADCPGKVRHCARKHRQGFLFRGMGGIGRTRFPKGARITLSGQSMEKRKVAE